MNGIETTIRALAQEVYGREIQIDEILSDEPERLKDLLARAAQESNVEVPTEDEAENLSTLQSIVAYVEQKQRAAKADTTDKGVTADTASAAAQNPPSETPQATKPPKPIEILRLEAEREAKREDRRSGVRIMLTQFAGMFLFGGGLFLAILALFAPDTAELAKAMTEDIATTNFGENPKAEVIKEAVSGTTRWVALTADGIQNAKDIFILVSPTAAMVIAFWFSGRKPKGENQ